jgi:sodium/potassium-transporting ATPase subunit alpha
MRDLSTHMLQNYLLFPSMIFAIVVVFIFCYIPSLQATIATREVPVEYWFLPASFGLGLLTLDEARKYCVRKWPNGILAKIAW